jgi:S-DNA-T family DNA segregation ATPase FtsK/SpoIIIE
MSEQEVQKIMENYDPRLDLSKYKFPPVSILKEHRITSSFDNAEVIENKENIIKTLGDHKIPIKHISATVGPTVTLYEIVPERGVRLAKIKSLENDIALNLSALGIRIIAPIPGRGTVGIEVPNKKPEVVSMRSLITSKAFLETKFDLALALGRTITNDAYIVDLTKMPHLLVAGATGQGKSVGINAIITSILYKKHPSEVKFVLIDPKRVELPLYTKIERHFLAKLPDEEDAIITDTQKVIKTLNSLCIEMDDRLELLKAAQSRHIKEYNEKFTSRKLSPEKGHRYMPYIVLIIDEFADLIMTAGREIEGPIGRLAQLARAIGIHLIISTQRPSANIITGFIKANFPTRIAFRVFSSIDSRTILDATGADRLVGRGDMLVSSGAEPVRVQCAFIDTPEIEELTDFIGSQQGYADAMHLPEYIDDSEAGVQDIDLKKRDNMFDEAAKLVVTHQQGSTSLIQRKLAIGYNRAGRIIDQLEAAGIVGPFEGSKARDVLITDLISLEQILKRLD